MLRQLISSEKTPISALNELCMQNDQFLRIEEDGPTSRNPKTFFCIANAFHLSAKGSGRSKKEAEHDACANLIARLITLDRFKNVFQKMPVTPRPKSDSDAVMALRNICVYRNWPLPSFNPMQSGGQPHMPMFTYECQLASIKRTGTFSTKKGAKQVATRAVIEIVQNFEQNEGQQLIVSMEAEQSDEDNIDANPPLNYFELVKSGAKLWAPRIRERHNYFLQLPKESRSEAEKILLDDSSATDGTSKKKVELTCAALKLKYKVIDISNQQKEMTIFYLLGNHNCVIAAQEKDLYDRVIAHFKTMLNIQKY